METSLSEMLLHGAKLMLIGMGIVYLFLALLVGVIGLTASVLRRFGPEPDGLPAGPGLAATADSGEADAVAAIAAALHWHRRR